MKFGIINYDKRVEDYFSEKYKALKSHVKFLSLDSEVSDDIDWFLIKFDKGKINEIKEKFSKKKLIDNEIKESKIILISENKDYGDSLPFQKISLENRCVHKIYASQTIGRLDEVTNETRAIFLSDLIQDVLENKTFNKNYELSRWLEFLNFSFKENFFKLGTISFIAPDSFDIKYAFDIPFKGYYNQMNSILTASKTEFLKTKTDDINSIYIRISVLNKRCYFYYEVIGGNPESPFNNYDVNTELINFWVLSLYYGVYFSNKTANELFENDNYKDIECVKVDKNSLEFTESTEIFWYYTRLHYNFLPEKGYLNYCFYKKNAKTPVTDTSGYSQNIYLFNNDFIEAKTLETVAPYYTEKLQQQVKRNQKLDIAAYNLSHTYAAHVFPTYVEYTNKIQKRIEEIYEKLLLDKEVGKKELDFLKERLNEQKINYNNLVNSLMVATHKINQPIQSTSYAPYNISNLFNQNLNRYFSYTEDLNLKQIKIYQDNFLGIGLNDGKESSVIRKVKSSENILLPYGEIGKTLLLMFISNVFRNIKKHSKTYLKGKLVKINASKEEIPNDYLKQFNNNKKEKPIFLLDINISEDEKLKQYWKVEFIERSRDYNTHKFKKIGKELEPDEYKDFLNKKFADFSDSDAVRNSGIKEMRIIASTLIGCPIEKIDFEKHWNNKSSYVEHKGEVFPSRLVTCEIDNGMYLKHCIYLRKEHFATIWVDDNKNYNYLKKEGIFVKKMDENIDLQSPAQFVIDCANKLNRITKSKRHFNFRVIKDNSKKIYELINNANDSDKANDLKTAIKQAWAQVYNENNTTLKYVDKNTDKENINESNYIIDEHFHFFIENSDLIPSNYRFVECKSSKQGSEVMKNFAKEEINRGANPFVLEAVNTNVFILDEGIQEIIDQEDKKDIVWSEKRLIDTLKWKGIIIPEKNGTVKLSKTDENSYRTDLLDWFVGDNKGKDIHAFIKMLNALLGNNTNKKLFNHLVIHFSGFEKIVSRSDFSKLEKDNKSKNEISRAYKLVKDSVCKNKNNFITFTSGKNPRNLPEEVFFVDKNSLSYHLVTKSSKYDIVQLLNNLRKSN